MAPNPLFISHSSRYSMADRPSPEIYKGLAPVAAELHAGRCSICDERSVSLNDDEICESCLDRDSGMLDGYVGSRQAVIIPEKEEDLWALRSAVADASDRTGNHPDSMRCDHCGTKWTTEGRFWCDDCIAEREAREGSLRSAGYEDEDFEYDYVPTPLDEANEGVTKCFCGCKYWEDGHCIDCGARVESIPGYYPAHTGSRRVAWTEDGSDITPGAQNVMEIVDGLINFDTGFGMGMSPEFDAAVKDAVAPIASSLTQADIDCLEDYDYHMVIRALGSRKTAALKGDAPCIWCGEPCYYTSAEVRDEDQRWAWGPCCDFDKHEMEIDAAYGEYAEDLYRFEMGIESKRKIAFDPNNDADWDMAEMSNGGEGVYGRGYDSGTHDSRSGKPKNPQAWDLGGNSSFVEGYNDGYYDAETLDHLSSRKVSSICPKCKGSGVYEKLTCPDCMGGKYVADQNLAPNEHRARRKTAYYDVGTPVVNTSNGKSGTIVDVYDDEGQVDYEVKWDEKGEWGDATTWVDLDEKHWKVGFRRTASPVKFPSKCKVCSESIPVGFGDVRKVDGAWYTTCDDHKPAPWTRQTRQYKMTDGYSIILIDEDDVYDAKKDGMWMVGGLDRQAANEEWVPDPMEWGDYGCDSHSEQMNDYFGFHLEVAYSADYGWIWNAVEDDVVVASGNVSSEAEAKSQAAMWAEDHAED